jgi:hypothetical protein
MIITHILLFGTAVKMYYSGLFEVFRGAEAVV